MMYPFVSEVLSTIRPVRICCPVVKELYGYCAPVIDRSATEARFREAYQAQSRRYNRGRGYDDPTRTEMEVFKGWLEEKDFE